MKLLALVAAEDPARTHHWLLPETPEIIYGGLASLLIFGLLYKFAGPAVRRAMTARADRIEAEVAAADQDRAAAEAEAVAIRQAKGDIAAERGRLLAEADAQAEALLRDGRARLEHELVELEQRADADIAGMQSRLADELRSEIGQVAGAAAARVLAELADDEALQQQLIEQFIQKVGASSAAPEVQTT